MERVMLRKGYRVTIPRRVVERLKLKPGTVFELRIDDERIVLQVLER